MTPFARPTCLLLASLLAAPAAAQSGTLTLHDKTIALGSSSPADSKSTLLVSDVTGDGSDDVVLLDDGSVVLHYGLGITQAAFPLANRVSAIAIVPTPPGLADLLLIVDDNKVRLYSDYSAGAFTVQALTVPGWPEASIVHATDFGSDGFVDLVGLSSDNLTVLILRDLNSGAPLASSFSLPSEAHDLALLDWAGTTDDEIAVLDANGLTIFDPTGVAVDSSAQPVGSGRLQPFSQAGYSKERCALLVHQAGSVRLQVLDDATADAALTLTGTSAYELAAADVDGDGDDDLFVQHGGAASQLLPNQSNGAAPGVGATFTLATSVGYSFPSGNGTSSQVVNPAFGDVDNDTDLDLVAYDGASDLLTLNLNQTVDVATRRIVLLNSTEPISELQLHQDPEEPPLVDRAGLHLALIAPPGVSQIGVDVWYQQGSTLADSEPNALFGGTFTVPPTTRTSIDVEFDTLTDAMDRVYNIDVYPLETVGSASVKGASTLLAVAFEKGLSDDLVNPPPPGESVVSEAPSPSLGFVDGRELAPSVICIPDIPPFCLPPEPVNPP